MAEFQSGFQTSNVQATKSAGKMLKAKLAGTNLNTPGAKKAVNAAPAPAQTEIVRLPAGVPAPKKPNSLELKAALAKVRTKLALVLPPKWEAPYGNGGALTHITEYRAVKIDSALFAQIQTAFIEAKAVTDEFTRCVQAVLEHHVSPGSLGGLINRIVTALQDVPDIEVAKLSFDNGKDAAVVAALFPTTLTEEAKIESTEDLSALWLRQEDRIDINFAAAPGMPVKKGTKEHSFEMDVAIANAFLRACATKETLLAFQQEHPDYFVLLLKNKTDVYKRSELTTKTRPYFVWPSFLNYVITSIMEPVVKGMAVFTEDFNSWNAYGLSWASGGADKVMKWASSAHAQPHHRRVCVYGDNILVAEGLAEGEFILKAFDIAHLDFTIHSAALPGVVRYIRDAYKKIGAPLPKVWSNALEVWRSMYVNAPFMIEGSLSGASIKHWGKSGGVGTTLVNTLVVGFVLDKVLKKHPGSLDLASLTKLLVPYGMKIKEEFISQVINLEEVQSLEEDTRVHLGFLGMDLVFHTGYHHWFPVLPMEKLFISAAYRKKSPPANLEPVYDITRMSGLTYVGAWYYPHLYDAFLKRESNIKANFQLDFSNMILDHYDQFDLPTEAYEQVPSVEDVVMVLTNDKTVKRVARLARKQAKDSGAEPVKHEFSSFNWVDLVEFEEGGEAPIPLDPNAKKMRAANETAGDISLKARPKASDAHLGPAGRKPKTPKPNIWPMAEPREKELKARVAKPPPTYKPKEVTVLGTVGDSKPASNTNVKKKIEKNSGAWKVLEVPPAPQPPLPKVAPTASSTKRPTPGKLPVTKGMSILDAAMATYAFTHPEGKFSRDNFEKLNDKVIMQKSNIDYSQDSYTKIILPPPFDTMEVALPPPPPPLVVKAVSPDPSESETSESYDTPEDGEEEYWENLSVSEDEA